MGETGNDYDTGAKQGGDRCDKHAPRLPGTADDLRAEPAAPPSLKPLKTVLEMKAGNSMIDVYITSVPVKSANTVLT